jgi:pimeloyl-ACP methyl ester carboxylesterase
MITEKFTSDGVTCAAWHLQGTGDAFSNDRGRPCVVMAHGFGGTRDTGLLAYAEGFAQAGLDVFLFDYRGFGDSAGVPRQLVSVITSRADGDVARATTRLRVARCSPDRSPPSPLRLHPLLGPAEIRDVYDDQGLTTIFVELAVNDVIS